jgi:hypothetical protein
MEYGHMALYKRIYLPTSIRELSEFMHSVVFHITPLIEPLRLRLTKHVLFTNMPGPVEINVAMHGRSYRTDKWAETDLGTRWGDKWEEKFFSGIGSRQGETWHASPGGDRKFHHH